MNQVNPSLNGPDMIRARAQAQALVPTSMPFRVPEPFLTPEQLRSQTLENVQGQQLGRLLRDAINLPPQDANSVAFADVSQSWLNQPWRAYPFLSRTLLNSPAMGVLQQWYGLAGQSVDAAHVATLWQNSVDPQVVAVRNLWAPLHARMMLYLRTNQTTVESLRTDRQNRATNFLERMGGDFWDYTWHDMADHPVTSGLLLFGGGMAAYSLVFGRLGKTPLGKGLKVGIGLTAIICFLRDKYGVEVVEDLFARPLERWGAPGVAQWLRDFRDTVTDPFRNRNEQQRGNAFTYLARNKIGVRGDDETTMLNAIFSMTPAEFEQAYNLVNQPGNMNQRINVPQPLLNALNQLRANREISARMESYDATQKMQLFRRVADKLLDAMPGNNRMQSLAFLRDRMVTGQYFAQVSAETQVQAQNGGPMSALARTRVVVNGIPSMTLAVQQANANRSTNMLDVALMYIMTEEDWRRIGTFGPSEAAARDMVLGVRNAAIAAFNAGVDAGRGIVNFFTGDVPRFWEQYIWPRIQAQRPLLDSALAELRRLGARGSQAVVNFGNNTAVGRIMRDALGWTVEQARAGYNITANEAYRLATWIELQRLQEAIGNADFTGWQNEFMQDFGAAAGTADRITFRGDHRIWRAIHDLGIARVENRNAITGSNSGGVILTREQAERLRLWIETVRGFAVPSGPSAAGGVNNGATNRPGPTEGAGPLPIPESLRARIDELEREGLFVQRSGGRFFVGFRNRTGENYFLPLTEEELASTPMPELLQLWRNNAVNRVLTLLNAHSDPIHGNFRPWHVVRQPGDMVTFGPDRTRISEASFPEAQCGLFELLQHAPAEIHPIYFDWATTDRALALAAGNTAANNPFRTGGRNGPPPGPALNNAGGLPSGAGGLPGSAGPLPSGDLPPGSSGPLPADLPPGSGSGPLPADLPPGSGSPPPDSGDLPPGSSP